MNKFQLKKVGNWPTVKIFSEVLHNETYEYHFGHFYLKFALLNTLLKVGNLIEQFWLEINQGISLGKKTALKNSEENSVEFVRIYPVKSCFCRAEFFSCPGPPV